MSICIGHYAKTPLMRYTRRSVTQTDAFSSHVETDQAQQLDHANCQAENSKLLGPAEVRLSPQSPGGRACLCVFFFCLVCLCCYVFPPALHNIYFILLWHGIAFMC